MVRGCDEGRTRSAPPAQNENHLRYWIVPCILSVQRIEASPTGVGYTSTPKRRQCHCRARHRPKKKRCSVYRFTATLDYPESAPLAALLARLVAILRRRSNPLRTQWCRLCHTPLQYGPPNPRHNGWVSANNVIQTSCQPPCSEHDPEWP
jgi:hypothetical protein